MQTRWTRKEIACAQRQLKALRGVIRALEKGDHEKADKLVRKFRKDFKNDRAILNKAFV